MTLQTTSRLRNALAAGLIMMVIATVSVLVPGGSSASAQSVCATLRVSGASLIGGSSGCHYAVTAVANWKKQCEGSGSSLNCTNLDDGEYVIDASTIVPWKSVDKYRLEVDGPDDPGGTCSKLRVSDSSIFGGSSGCHYAVTAVANWKKQCEGSGSSLNCTNLDGGKYIVDAHTSKPWKSAGKYSLTVGDDDPQTSECNGSRRFFDDFDGSSLRDDLWETGFYWEKYGVSSNAAGGKQTYVQSLSDPVFSVSNSLLTIKPRRSGNEHLSGALTAQSNDSHFKAPQGCFEIRARFPDGLGVFPAFWMISDSGPDWTMPGFENEADYRPEIDVVETIGQTGIFYTTAHHLGSASNHLTRFPAQGVDNSKRATVTSEFHTFSVRWQNNAVIWYLDGNEIQRTNVVPETGSMFVHLNYALGYEWGERALENQWFNGSVPTYQIDYVKVTS